MFLQKCTATLRNLHHILSHQRTNICSRSHKSLAINNDFFDTAPLEELAVKSIEESCAIRKTNGNIEQVENLLKQFRAAADETNKSEISHELRAELRKIPNRTHPTVLGYGDVEQLVEIASFGEKKDAAQTEAHTRTTEKVKKKTKGKLIDSQTICTGLNIMRKERLGLFCGSRAYYLMSDLAEMEQALIRYSTNYLLNNGFHLVAVPDILPAEIIDGCGMATSSERTQVYRLQPSDRCLSGTSEMALGGFMSGKTFKHADLPKKFMAVSRCFRAEVSGGKSERGIYRVHNFTKVEMFSVCLPQHSDDVLEEFNDIQCKIFSSMGLHFKVFDMPISDLGAPAYRKYDVEAWMPGRGTYGEISSSSNCTDFQAKRLNIFANDANGNIVHAHTVNGTACAVPRMLIAILEQFQHPNGSIEIPKVLQKYMGGRTKIVKRKLLPAARFSKQITKE